MPAAGDFGTAVTGRFSTGHRNNRSRTQVCGRRSTNGGFGQIIIHPVIRRVDIDAAGGLRFVKIRIMKLPAASCGVLQVETFRTAGSARHASRASTRCGSKPNCSGPPLTSFARRSTGDRIAGRCPATTRFSPSGRSHIQISINRRPPAYTFRSGVHAPRPLEAE